MSCPLRRGRPTPTQGNEKNKRLGVEVLQTSSNLQNEEVERPFSVAIFFFVGPNKKCHGNFFDA